MCSLVASIVSLEQGCPKTGYYRSFQLPVIPAPSVPLSFFYIHPVPTLSLSPPRPPPGSRPRLRGTSTWHIYVVCLRGVSLTVRWHGWRVGSHGAAQRGPLRLGSRFRVGGPQRSRQSRSGFPKLRKSRVWFGALAGGSVTLRQMERWRSSAVALDRKEHLFRLNDNESEKQSISHCGIIRRVDQPTDRSVSRLID